MTPFKERGGSGSVFREYSPERLDVAPVMYHLQQLPSRIGLRPRFLPFEEVIVEEYQAILGSLDRYVRRNYPGWRTVFPVYAHTEVPHGSEARVILDLGRLDQSDLGTTSLVERGIREVDPRANWTAGVVGCVRVIEDELAILKGASPSRNLPWVEFRPEMILPVADLEIVARGELPENLVRAALVLADHGFSGLLFQSGTEGRGRHSFLADFLLPEEDYVGLMAIFMKILTPPECQMTDLVELWCQTLQTTISSDQVIAVATHMLKEIPPDTETGSWIDLRWVAHLLEDVGSRENIKGVSVLKRPRLRSLPAKSYPRSPQCLGEISYWRGQDDEVIFASGWPC